MSDAVIDRKRVYVFLAIFGGMNLSFIPLLSVYGLRVCPVLSVPGFGFGCYYSGLYVGTLLVANSTLLLAFVFGHSLPGLLAWLVRYRTLVVSGIYLSATLFALGLLQFMLKLNHLSQSSRAPQILLLSSLLLGITQSYGMTWATFGLRHGEKKSVAENVWMNWFYHVSRVMFPLVIVISVLLHFLLGQSVSFNAGQVAPVATGDQLIEQTALVVVFLGLWLSVTFVFHFLAERDQVVKVETHFAKLGLALETKYRTALDETWGLWRSIAFQLNGFSQALHEKSKLLDAFSKFVSSGVAKDVLQEDRLSTSGVTQEMTVIMVDIRGFTTLSESMAPGQVVELLNEYFSAMLSVVSALQVTIDKFIGDGILAYVDFVDSQVEENREAVRAALAMLQAMNSLNEVLRRRGLPEIKIGIGIYRGPLIIGLIGTDKKMQHTIIGDTVNRAARLEGLCKDLGVSIVVSGWVWHSLDESTQAHFKNFGPQSVKGIAEKMEIFGGPV